MVVIVKYCVGHQLRHYIQFGLVSIYRGSTTKYMDKPGSSIIQKGLYLHTFTVQEGNGLQYIVSFSEALYDAR